LFHEIKVHQGLKHKYIVDYKECLEDNEFVYLILELCESRTLMDLIRRRKRLIEPEVRYYLRQIVEACAYMHQNKIVHRDLKLGNIFISHDMDVKIGDFGLATVIMDENDRKTTICGTPNYIAPEILFNSDEGHRFEVDIWSVGVIMYTLLIGKPPFQTSDVKAIYKKIRNVDYVFPDEHPISQEAKNLIRALLIRNPASRLPLSEVLNHPFFACGYTPEKLDRETLLLKPNFDAEEAHFQRLLENHRAQQQQMQVQEEHPSPTTAEQHGYQQQVPQPSQPSQPQSKPQSPSYQPQQQQEQLKQRRNIPSALPRMPRQQQQRSFDTHEDPTFGTHDVPKSSIPRTRLHLAERVTLPKPSAEQQRQLDAMGYNDDEYEEEETRRYSDIPPAILEITSGAPHSRSYAWPSQQKQTSQRETAEPVRENSPAVTATATAATGSALSSPSIGNNRQQQQTIVGKAASFAHGTRASPSGHSRTMQEKQLQQQQNRLAQEQSIGIQTPQAEASTAAGTITGLGVSRLPVSKSRIGTPSYLHLQSQTHTHSPDLGGGGGDSTANLNTPSKVNLQTNQSVDSQYVQTQQQMQQQQQEQAASMQSQPPAQSQAQQQHHSSIQPSAQKLQKHGEPSAGSSQIRKHYSSQPLSRQFHQQSSQSPQQQQQQQKKSSRNRGNVPLSSSYLRKPDTEHLWDNPTDAQGAKDLFADGIYNSRSPSPDQPPHNMYEIIALELGSSPTGPQNDKIMSSLSSSMPQPFSQGCATPGLQVEDLHQQRQQEQQFTSPLQLQNQQAAEQQLILRSSNSLSQPAHQQQQHELHRRRSRQLTVIPSAGSEPEPQHQQHQPMEQEHQDSSMDQSLTQLEFEEKRHQQIQQRRRLQQQKLLKQQQRPQLSSTGGGSGDRGDVPGTAGGTVGSGPSPTEQHPSNFNKRSNETTMAGISSGGHSDEQDHVEVPSTSCITTHSMSMSLQHDQHLQPSGRQQQQQQQQHTLQEEQQSHQLQQEESGLDGKAGIMHLRSKNPNSQGMYEQVESHLSQMLQARKEGLVSVLEHRPGRLALDTLPTVPRVFVSRWMKYPRYGVGWCLMNGVMGVFFNDKTIVSVSPNDVDVEIIEAPQSAHKPFNSDKSPNAAAEPPAVTAANVGSATTAPSLVNNSTQESHMGQKGVMHHRRRLSHVGEVGQSQRDHGEKVYRDIGDHRVDESENRATDAASAVVSSLDLKDSAMLPTTSTKAMTTMASMSISTEERHENEHVGGSGELPSMYLQQHDTQSTGRPEEGSRGGDSVRKAAKETFFDEWDHDWFLASLDRIHCQKNDYPLQFEKKLSLQTKFKDYMIQCLREIAPWSYEDRNLTRDMPFVTSYFRRNHVLIRLSNGIVQVNYADHTKIVFSDGGRVLTFMDAREQRPVRLTMTVQQAFVRRFFYDPEDEHDRKRKVKWEVTRLLEQDCPTKLRLCWAQGATAEGKREADVVLRPTEKALRDVFRGHEEPSLSEPSMELLEGHRLVSIRSMTFQELHEGLLLRIRIAQQLLQEQNN
ncbi:Cell cycle serine/threonine-protein kinase cdc5/MSD2, partial [Podila epigama]